MQLTKHPRRDGHHFRYKGRRIAPLSTVDPVDCIAPQTAQRVYCPVCEKCLGVARTYDSRYDEPTATRIVSRIGYCDHCEAVFWWDQYAVDANVPTGRPIEGSLVTNNRPSMVEHVLKVYPELTGILQT